MHQGQHPGIGAQRIPEKTTRPGIRQALPVSSFWLLAALRQVQAPPGLATGAIEQVPAVGHQLQPILQRKQGRVGLPGQCPGAASLDALHSRLGLQFFRTQRLPAVAAAGAARAAARQRGWGGWGLLPARGAAISD